MSSSELLLDALFSLVRRLRRRTTLGHVAVISGFVFLIGLFSYLVQLAVGHPDGMLREFALTGVIALPFVLVIHAVVQYAFMLEDRLTDNARRDSLTGLYNGRSFVAAIEELRAQGTGGLLVVIDADHFKRLNDSYGHHIGDAALIQTAGLLRSLTRNGDLCGRLGGEEFAIYLPGPKTPLTQGRWTRLCDGIQVDANGETVRVTFSAGAAYLPAEGTYESAFQAADAALYVAKNGGRRRLCCAPDLQLQLVAPKDQTARDFEDDRQADTETESGAA